MYILKNKLMRVLAFALVLTTMLFYCADMGGAFVRDSKAASISIGVVTATSQNVRSGPGTEYGVLGYLHNGDIVTIIDQAKASTGTVWYKINFGSGYGYVSSVYINITGTYDPDDAAGGGSADSADFEEFLKKQGFPESYKVRLREIHAAHPNWVFKANHLGLDWNTALAAESAVGVSLVSKSSIDSWKSMEKGAYNWNTNTWYGLDGSSWVAASEQIVAYYMDPRNFLDDTYIFMFEQLSYDPSVHNEAGVKAILSGTFMDGSYTTPDTKVTKTYSSTFMEAAAATGVSPYHLASRARQEQGVKGTELAFGTVSGYSGYFNFFNIQAYATSTMTARQMGAKYASTTNAAYSLPWTNQYKSITGGAAFIGTSYISRGQDTLYLQKFDMVDGGNGYYSHQYMTNIQAAASEAASMKKAYNSQILASALVFTIPVYDNMPDTACVKPTSTGNNNNFLSSLSVSGYSLSPSFNMYTSGYTLTVSENTSSIAIVASPKTSAASVSGTGTKTVNYGINKFVVTVTAPSGYKRDYYITVTRPGSPSNTEPTPSVTVLGDVNFDGAIDVVDSLMIMQHVAESITLTGDSLIAADVNRDGYVDVVDALMTLQYNAGLITSF